METGNPVNPFITSLSAPSSSFNLLAGRGPPTGANQQNVFKPPSKGQQEQENQQNAVNVAPSPKNVRLLFQKPSADPPRQEAVNAHRSAASDTIQLKMHINGKACEINKTAPKETNTFADLGRENMKVAVPRQVAMALGVKIKITQHIIVCLGALYQRIRDNSLTILEYFKNTPIKNGRDCLAIRLRKDQHARLLKGLFYYQKGKSNAVKVLAACIGEHPLGKAVLAVAEKLDLDALLAYYVVRSVHEDKGLLPKNATSFFVQKVEVLPEAIILKLSEEFLRQDKLNLLSCYLQLMKEHLPSTFRLLSKREELDILWGNLSNFEKEDNKVKETVLFIFMRYWELCDSRLKVAGTELAYMRKRMLGMRLSETERTKMVEIGVNDVLSQDLGQFKEIDFPNPFKELFYFFLQNKWEINCQQALQNLRKVQLSLAWQRHIYCFLQRFIGSKEVVTLQHYLYINQVLSKLKAKRIFFPPQLREKLMLKVMKQCSLVLGMVYLQDVCSDIYSPSVVNLLFGIEEKSIKQCFKRDQTCLSKWISDLSVAKIIDIQISFLQASIVSIIKLGGIASLQQEISVAGFYCLNLANSNFKFLRRYYQCFIKSTVSKIKIQRNINQAIRLLQENKLDISHSLQQYHQKILKFTKEPLLLSCHLIFLYEVVRNVEELVQFSKSWVHVVNSEGLFHDFADFAQIVTMIGQKLLQTDNQKLLDMFSSVAKLFDREIKQTFSNNRQLEENALTLYYVLKKVVKWCRTQKNQDQHIQSLYEMARSVLKRQSYDMKRIVTKQERLNPSIRLFVLLDITTDEDIIELNHLNMLLFQYPQLKEQLYTRISKDLKGKRDPSVVEAFSLASCHDQQLLRFLMQNNLVDLAQSLKEVPLNLTTISMMLSFGARITELIQFCGGGRDMQNIVKGILLRVIVAYKETSIPAFAFVGLLKICSNNLSIFQYSIHIDLLDRGHKSGFLPLIKSDKDHDYSEYFLYLLCMYIAKVVKKNMDINGSLPFEVEIFIDIGIMLLETKQLRTIESDNFVLKLSHYLDNLTKHKHICYQISKGVASLQQALEKSKYSQKQALEVLKNVRNNIQRGQVDHETELKINREDLTAQIINFMNNYIKEAEPDKKRHYIKKIMQQMEERKDAKIVLSFVPTSEHLANDKQLLFLFFMSRLVDKVDFRRIPKEVGKFMIKYVGNYSFGTLSTNSEEYSKAVKCYIKVINKLVSNSIVYAISLYENSMINEQLKIIFTDLKRTINYWPEVPNQALLKLLHTIQLDIEQLPEQWKMSQRRHSYYGKISMWRLLQFRQKLDFIQEILTFSRWMNGILPKQYLSAHQDMFNFVRFFSENIPAFQDKSSIEKLKAVNKWLDGGISNAQELSLRMMKPISLKELKCLCGKIAGGLCALNMEIGPQVIENLGLSKNDDF